MRLRWFVIGLAVVVMAGVVAPPAKAVADQLCGRWRWGAGGIVEINCDGSGRGSDGQTVQWTVRDAATRTYTLRWSHGFTDTVTLAPDGNSLTVVNNQGFRFTATRTDGSPSGVTTPPPPPPTVLSLTGSWVHSADPTFKTHDSKVILIQTGTEVTMTRSEKYNDRWIVSVCHGALSGNRLRGDCHYVSGGNPFGFPDTVESWVVSQDGNHLDGTIRGGVESHYSRIP